jgi:hypothetical protein
MSNILFFILSGFFAWRVTHLLIDDSIMEKPVNWIFKISKSNKYVLKLFTCYYCLGFWVSLVTYVLITVFTPYFHVSSFFEHVILIGALSSLPPLIQEFIPEEK